MARVTITELNTQQNPAVFSPDPTDGRKRAIKRLQLQYWRSGFTATSWTLMGRLSEDAPWATVGTATTPSWGILEVPPYPHLAVFFQSCTGTGTLTVELREP